MTKARSAISSSGASIPVSGSSTTACPWLSPAPRTSVDSAIVVDDEAAAAVVEVMGVNVVGAFAAVVEVASLVLW